MVSITSIIFTLAFVAVAVLVFKSFAAFSTIHSKPCIISYIMLWVAFFIFKLSSWIVMAIYGAALIACIVIWKCIEDERTVSKNMSKDWNSNVSNGLNAVFGKETNVVTGFLKNKIGGVLYDSQPQECDWVDVGKGANVVYCIATLICVIVFAVNS